MNSNYWKILIIKKNEMKIKIALLFFGCCVASVQAQQSNHAAGGNGQGSGGTIAYSVGQVVYTSIQGSNGSLAQGVQQPYEISTVLGLEESQINLSINAYPNPTSSFLTLTVGDFELLNLNFQMFDIKGQLIKCEKVTNSTTTIFMEDLPSATYIFKIINNNKEVKTFKIIKH